MNILMFGWEFPPYISGGLGTACHGLTRSLAEMGSNITFVLPKTTSNETRSQHLRILGGNHLPGLPLEVAGEGSVSYHSVDTLLHPYMSADTYRTEMANLHQTTEGGETGVDGLSGNYGPNLMAEVRRYSRVGALLGSRSGFDLIHAHDWMTFPAGMEAKKTSRKPLIVHVHATEFDRAGENINPEIYEIERSGMECADRVIAVSNWTRNKILDRYGINPEKVEVVHNGIAKDAHIRRDQAVRHLREKIVLFLGRVTMQKGPEYFLEAAAKVLRDVDNVRFVMAGSGDLLPQMIERMAELRLQDRFHFTGFLSGWKREQIYAMSDLFVMPSVSEPFGLTPIEAMQYDVPVIVSRQSGVAEVLPDAIKVDFWDVEKLAAAIVEVLTNQETAHTAIENGRRELAAIDWNRAAGHVKNIYNQLSC